MIYVHSWHNYKCQGWTAVWVTWTKEVGRTIHQHILTQIPPQDWSITLATEAWFICRQIKAAEVERVERLFLKARKKTSLSLTWRLCYSWKQGTYYVYMVHIYTHTQAHTYISVVCCKLSYYITPNCVSHVCRHTAYILDCEWIRRRVWF